MDDTHSPDNNELKYWLALLHAPGLGSVGIGKLLEVAGTPQALFSKEFIGHKQLPNEIRAYLRSPDWRSVDRDLEWASQEGRHILTQNDSRYPQLLIETSNPPVLLFIHGDPEILGRPQLAIVGSRNPTASGRQTAGGFARFLAASGIVITSGMAIGIDAAAHQGALEAGGKTIAVTGTGLDRVYPARHRDLAHHITEQGALVSEFPPETKPLPGNFPRRNRIISGLSLGTLVVEAAVQSGSLITARQAAEQGREVFAIPGSIHNPLARGCHSLIRQGAKLVETAADIIEELGALLGTLEAAPAPTEHPTETSRKWDADYHQLLDALGFDPIPIDLLIQRSGLTAEAVSSMLLVLELEEYVLSAPGGLYSRTGKTGS